MNDTGYLSLLLLLASHLAHADPYGTKIGIGLKDCVTKHPQLLSSWEFNASWGVMRSLDATEVDKVSDFCLGISDSIDKLPANKPGVGAGLELSPCPRFDPEANKSSHAQYFAFNSSNGLLVSLWAGDESQASPAGLCVDHAESGAVELVVCNAQTTTWSLDGKTGELTPQPSTARQTATASTSGSSCLCAVNTSGTALDPSTMGAGNCSTPPHSLLPYCDETRSIDERIDNVISFAVISDLPYDFKRLGFPHAPPTGECLHGFVTDCVDDDTCTTLFPDALASASSFNDTLFQLIGKAISVEGRAVVNIAAQQKPSKGSPALKPHSICWSPNINPFRHPLWGRGQEVPSEDPLLCGRYGSAYIRGLQGAGDPDGKGYLRMVASPKHFVGYDMEGMGPGMHSGSTYSGPWFNRHNFTNRMSAQELIEYYALPFRKAIVDGGALGVMCSYNAVDVYVQGSEENSTGSIPACAFTALQDGMVRGQWNFSGYIVSDCGAIADFLDHNECSGCPGQYPGAFPKGSYKYPTHGLCTDANYSSTCPECASTCMNEHMYSGGTDTACGSSGNQYGALANGDVSKAQLVVSARRILRVLISLGLGGLPSDKAPYTNLGHDDIGSDAHKQLNLEAARQSVVLLKNDVAWEHGERVLPIKPGMTVAAIGPVAANANAMLSNYHPEPPSDIVTPYQALLNSGFNTSYAEGAGLSFVGSQQMLDEAVQLAEDCDVALVFVGLNLGQECESTDRNQTGFGLSLPGNQQELIRRVQEANARTAVILVHGSPVSVEYAKEFVPAVLTAHYPGVMGGVALADVITGAYNPSGRLTHTFYPASYGNKSIFDTSLRANGGQTYMHYDPASHGAPLWEFGHGLSYANFSVEAGTAQTSASTEDLMVSSKGVEFEVDVTNNGGPDGAFSALGFVMSNHSEAPRNGKLFDYARANIAANTTVKLTVRLTAENGALVEADGTTVLLPGSYSVKVADVHFNFELTGERVVVAPPPPLFD